MARKFKDFVTRDRPKKRGPRKHKKSLSKSEKTSKKIKTLQRPRKRLMEIVKHFKMPIQVRIEYIEAQLENVDADYFIDIIDKNISEKTSYKTNVKAEMTDWRLFNHDPKFLDIVTKGICDTKIQLPPQSKILVKESWGIKVKKGEGTLLHNHRADIISGILYLNDCPSSFINFPEIELKTKPTKGKLLFFTGTLNHETASLQDEIKYAIPFNLTEHPI